MYFLGRISFNKHHKFRLIEFFYCPGTTEVDLEKVIINILFKVDKFQIAGIRDDLRNNRLFSVFCSITS